MLSSLPVRLETADVPWAAYVLFARVYGSMDKNSADLSPCSVCSVIVPLRLPSQLPPPPICFS